MKLIMFTVFDVKAEAYLPPFFLPNESMAMRIFSDMAGDTDHQFGKHPEDYTLFKLGEFDDNSSKINMYKTAPELVSTALQAKSLNVEIPIDIKEAKLASIAGD